MINPAVPGYAAFMAELNARDTKLVQFLNEAHAKEAELEADLATHINLTQKAPYKKRLQQHLRETKDHKRRVASRIKALRGTPSSGVRAPGVPTGVGELAGKGLAAVKGQVGVARAAVTNQAETHLRNARDELREEYVEIGIYASIEAFATEVGDRETAQLAKSIRRDEQKTADYIERLIPTLVKEVVRAEIPRDQRATPRRRSTRRRSTSHAAGARSRTATGVVRSGTRSSAIRSSSGRSSSGRTTSRSSGTRGGSTSRNGASASRRTTPRSRA